MYWDQNSICLPHKHIVNIMLKCLESLNFVSVFDLVGLILFQFLFWFLIHIPIRLLGSFYINLQNLNVKILCHDNLISLHYTIIKSFFLVRRRSQHTLSEPRKSHGFVLRFFNHPIHPQAQRARGKLIREVRESFSVDAFIGNATDWEKVCIGNLVGLPVIVVPTGLKNISNPPSNDTTKRRTTITTGIYAPPHKDHIVMPTKLQVLWTKNMIDYFCFCWKLIGFDDDYNHVLFF